MLPMQHPQTVVAIKMLKKKRPDILLFYSCKVKFFMVNVPARMYLHIFNIDRKLVMNMVP